MINKEAIIIIIIIIITTTLKIIIEAAIGGVSWKKVFLKTSQNSQEDNCVGVCV